MEPCLQPLRAPSFLPLRLHLTATTPLRLPPSKGSAFRGGRAFEETVCVVERRECARCLLRTRCAYSYVFDTLIPEAPGYR